MKIKFGALVVEGRGKLGGHVASKNGSGAYLRTKTTPTNPQTVFQSQARTLFATISQRWSGLTSSQRSGWNGAVSDWSKTDVFGDLKKPSGKALFQRLNNQAQSSGYNAVEDVPAKLQMVEGILTNGTINIGASALTINGVYAGGDARVVVSATTSLSQGTKFVKNKLRQINGDIGSSSNPPALYTSYTDRFGIPTAGDNVYIGVKYVLPNGQASPMQIIKVTVS